MSISNIDRNKEPFVPQTVFSKPNRSGTVYQTTQQIEKKISRKISLLLLLGPSLLFVIKMEMVFGDTRLCQILIELLKCLTLKK